MDTVPSIWLLVVAGGPFVLGLLIAIALVVTSRRRRSHAAQQQTEEATKRLYRKEDRDASGD